jgi:hypothetical protein
VRISGVRVTANKGYGIFSRNALIERTVVAANQKGIAGYGMLIVDSMIKRNIESGLSDTSNNYNPPTALKGTVLHGNGPAGSMTWVKSLGGNLIDGAAF